MQLNMSDSKVWELELTPTGSTLTLFTVDPAYVPPCNVFIHSILVAHRRYKRGETCCRPLIQVHIIGGSFVHVSVAPLYATGFSKEEIIALIRAEVSELDEIYHLGLQTCLEMPLWTEQIVSERSALRKKLPSSDVALLPQLVLTALP